MASLFSWNYLQDLLLCQQIFYEQQRTVHAKENGEGVARWPRAQLKKGDRRAIDAGLARLGFVAEPVKDERGDDGEGQARTNASNMNMSWGSDCRERQLHHFSVC
jgi:hypothetical protein